MSLACVQCETGAIVPRPTIPPSPTDAACWSHQLEALLGEGRDEARFVLIVARHELALFERVSDQLLDEPRVSVVLDRRRGDRREADAGLARLRRDRRRPRPFSEDARDPITIVAVGTLAPAVRVSSPRGPLAAGAGATVRRRVPRWLAEARARFLAQKARLTARLRQRIHSS
jgi:hypothetical protein